MPSYERCSRDKRTTHSISGGECACAGHNRSTTTKFVDPFNVKKMHTTYSLHRALQPPFGNSKGNPFVLRKEARRAGGIGGNLDINFAGAIRQMGLSEHCPRRIAGFSYCSNGLEVAFLWGPPIFFLLNRRVKCLQTNTRKKKVSHKVDVESARSGI